MRATKRYLAIALIISLTALNIAQANSATSKSTLLVNVFQKFIQDANAKYASNQASLDNSFNLQISDATQKLSSAVSESKNFNKIKVLKLGDNRNYWGSFNCPLERPECIAVDKGPAFQVGEITTIKDAIFQNVPNLEEITLIKNLGLIQIIDEVNFMRISDQIKLQTKLISGLKTKYALESAFNKRSLDEALVYENAINQAVQATKRANLNSKDFENAFVVAFKFSYNRDGLDKLASAPWNYITNLKALDSAIKITRISQQADSIDSSYKMVNANSLNKICGNTFTSESDFKRDYAFIAKLYYSATKISLKN